MKRSLILAATVFSLAGLGWVAGIAITPAAAQSAAVQKAVETKIFAIQNMTCEACPITVRKAMEGVKGVTSVKVDFVAKTATVVFDPSVTTSDAIAAASKNAGYPAAIKG